MLSRFADWACAIFRSVTVSSARRSKMRCGAPIKTMHPPSRRRSDPSLRSASMALSERRRGQVSTSFRQPRTRNTPTSYQKHANFVPETSQRRPAFHLLRLLFGTPSRPRPLSESSEAPSAYPMALYGQGHSKGAPASLGFRAGFPFRSARLSFPFPFLDVFTNRKGSRVVSTREPSFSSPV